MTTQASPASIKSRFACKAQPYDRFSKAENRVIGPALRRPPLCDGIQSVPQSGTKKRPALPGLFVPDPALLGATFRVSKCGFSGTTFRIYRDF